MKKILGLTVAALLVMGLVGGGTWAYFSDPEQSLGNTITAGTLNLTPDWNGSAVITFTDVVPQPDGTNTNVFATTLTNAGDMDGFLQIDFDNLANEENTQFTEQGPTFSPNWACTSANPLHAFSLFSRAAACIRNDSFVKSGTLKRVVISSLESSNTSNDFFIISVTFILSPFEFLK